MEGPQTSAHEFCRLGKAPMRLLMKLGGFTRGGLLNAGRRAGNFAEREGWRGFRSRLVLVAAAAGALILVTFPARAQLSEPQAATNTPVAATNTATGPVIEVQPYTAVSNGPHNRVLEHVTAIANPSGGLTYHTNRYTELATGLNYLSNGQWVASSEEIGITATGGQATNAAHPVQFAGNANTVGATQLMLPDGTTLSSRVWGLAYLDVATGKTVLLSELQDSIGELIATNEVLYGNALGGDCSASILYKFTKAGLEQNVVINQQPPSPGDYSLNPDTTLLEVLTQFTNAPDPVITTNFVYPKRLSFGLADETIRWGSMKMAPVGKAFLIGDAHGTNRPARVFKQWVQLPQGQFLAEQIPLSLIASQLATLPLPPPASGTNAPTGGTNSPAQGASLRTPRYVFQWPLIPQLAKSPAGKGNLKSVSLERGVHGVADQPAKKAPLTVSVRLASADTPALRGFLIDYTILDSDTNDYTFIDGQTYYISSPLYISGTVTLEGAIIKYAIGASIDLDTIDCETWGNEAVLTAQDDDTYGEILANSTHITGDRKRSAAC
jgi:hypothetical protein